VLRSAGLRHVVVRSGDDGSGRPSQSARGV